MIKGPKQGISEKLFYKRLIKKADDRFDKHPAAISTVGKRKRD